MKSVKTIRKIVFKLGFLFLLIQLISLPVHCQNEASQPSQEGSSAISEGSQEREIALHIYFYDDWAFKKNHSDYIEFLFAEIKPDVEFRRIVIDSNNEGAEKLLRDELQKTLSEGETFKYLIIDTHGTFIEGPEHQNSSTILANIGNFDEFSVNDDFYKNLISIKLKAARDLQVILNSCSTFCGDKNDSQKRAQSFLNYFNADNGSIYGAQTAERDNAIYDSKYKKTEGRVRYSVISDMLKSMGGTLALLSIMSIPNKLNEFVLDFKDTFLPASIAIGIATSASIQLAELVRTLVNTYTLNRGYLFTFKNGVPEHSFRVFKIRDMRKLISGKFCKNSTKKQ